MPTAFLALDHGECKVDGHYMVDLLARLAQRSLRAHPPKVDGGQKLMLTTLPRTAAVDPILVLDNGRPVRTRATQ
ncbi:hypothetical protein BJD99_14810 [Rhodococcus sp. 1163]|nr:hypothetical protein BJD99_14810 [Rhodococcus sp. 1163]